MATHQTVQPTPHPTQVRAIAVELALKSFSGMPDKELIEGAKVIELYLWGGLAPIEVAATPLNTIEEALQRGHDIALELSQNCADILKRKKLEMIQGQIQRFIADINVILA